MKFISNVFHIVCSAIGLMMFFLNPLFLLCLVFNGGSIEKVMEELFYEV